MSGAEDNAETVKLSHSQGNSSKKDSSFVQLSLPRVVPWSTWNEWDTVRMDLCLDNEHNDNPNANVRRRRALEMITMWKNRGRLPLAIASTAALLKVCLSDHLSVKYSTSQADTAPSSASRKTELKSTEELRGQYSIAIIRAVNGLVDPSQKGVFAESIYTIASRIGLPGWIVEMRHDATHDALPNIDLLRQGAESLLNWFLMNYWNMQQDYIRELSILCLSMAEETRLDATERISISGPNIQGQSVSSKNQFTGSVTFMTSILFPMLIQSLTLSPDTPISPDTQPHGDRSEDSNQIDERDNICRLCWDRISTWIPLIHEFEQLMHSSLSFSVQLTYHLIVNYLDILERISHERKNSLEAVISKEISWNTYILHSWRLLFHAEADKQYNDFIQSDIDGCLKKYSNLCGKMSFELFLDDKLVQSLLYRTRNMKKEYHKISNIFESLEKYIQSWATDKAMINSIPLDGSHIPISKKRSLEDIKAMELDSSKRIRSDISATWKISEDFPCWPIGLMPGCSVTELYDVEEA